MSEKSKYFKRVVDSADTAHDHNIRVEQLYPQTDGQSTFIEGKEARDLLRSPGRVALQKVVYDPSSNGEADSDTTQKLEFRLREQTFTVDGWGFLENGAQLVEVAEDLFRLSGLSLVVENGITLRHNVPPSGPQ